MNFIGKLTLIFIALIVIISASITAFIHFYLTDAKIRDLVIPQAEKTLGRKVTIGSIDVGIFSGVTIKNFTIKEKDQQTDFIKTESFVFSYNLMPLLQKKFVVSEVSLNQPTIRIFRDKTGKYNFNSLAVLALAKSTTETNSPKPVPSLKSTGLPIALTIKKITINKAALTFTDEKKEMPTTSIETDLNVALNLGSSLDTLNFKGDLSLTANASYNDLTPKAYLKANFTQKKFDYTIDLNIDKEKLKISGSIDQFLKNTPDILCNISSPQLDLDHLMALWAVLPKSPKKSASTIPQSSSQPSKSTPTPTPIAESIPPGLTAHGLVSVEKGFYNKLSINDFRLQYDLKKGVLNIEELSAKTAGGSINSKTTIDLNTPDTAYKGTVSVDSINLQQLGSGLEKSFSEIVSGSLKSDLNFNGSGITPEVIKKSLDADLSYKLSDGQIKNSQTTRSIATLTGLEEFKEVKFNDIIGNLKLLKGGQVDLSSSMNSSDFKAETSGKADLDGNLNLPITVTLSKSLSKKLNDKRSITKFLANENGETEIKLQVSGTISEPKTSLDSAKIQEQLTDTIKTKAINELDRLILKQQEKSTEQQSTNAPEENDPTAPVLNILKGFLGQ